VICDGLASFLDRCGVSVDSRRLLANRDAVRCRANHHGTTVASGPPWLPADVHPERSDRAAPRVSQWQAIVAAVHNVVRQDVRMVHLCREVHSETPSIAARVLGDGRRKGYGAMRAGVPRRSAARAPERVVRFRLA